MVTMLNAHFLTVFIIVGSIMVTPLYALATYVFSGASPKKGMQIGTVFLIWGAFMFWICLNDVPRRIGLAGNLIVPISWLVPSLILIWQRAWFLSH